MPSRRPGPARRPAAAEAASGDSATTPERRARRRRATRARRFAGARVPPACAAAVTTAAFSGSKASTRFQSSIACAARRLARRRCALAISAVGRGAAAGRRFVAGRVGEVAAQLGAHVVEPGLGQVGAQVVGHRADVGIAVVGLARQRPRDDPRQRLVDAPAGRARIGEAPFADPPQHLVRVLPREGEGAGRQQVEHDPDGEDVGAEVELLAFDQLGRHVRRGAEQLPGDRHPLQVERPARCRSPSA